MKKTVAIVLFLASMLNAEVLTFKTLKNEYIKIDNDNGVFSFRNKMYQNVDVLLYFFGRDCPHCKREIYSSVGEFANHTRWCDKNPPHPLAGWSRQVCFREVDEFCCRRFFFVI